jgi:hypothetical protein
MQPAIFMKGAKNDASSSCAFEVDYMDNVE